MRRGGSRRRAASVLIALALSAGTAGVAFTQAPRPSVDVPYPGQQQGYQQQQQQGYGQQPAPTAHELRCLQLEQELANDWVTGQQGSDQLPKIDEQIRKYDRIYQTTRAKAERNRCYQSMFIFGRSLVRTPRCIKLHNQVEDARQRLASLQQQREALTNRRSRRDRQNELISALARAGCGSQYQRESRRRGGGGWFTSLFEDDTYRSRRQDLQTSKIVPFATYRTLCVRTCDGYYFPVSYSTLPSRFSTDVAKCQDQCAAPAELFVYRNPGEEPEQMVSADGRTAYNDLPNAWRYRKEYVKGCSCKSTEYDPAEIELANQKAENDQSPPSDQVAQDPSKIPPPQ